MKYFDIKDIFAMISWLWKNEKTKFENEFADFIGIRYALGTSFGRTALYTGLKAIDVKDKEVLLPAFTCTVVRQAVVMSGAVPRFVDVDFGTFDMDLDDLKRKVSPKTKAIILTHYFGRVAGNIEAVIQLAKQNNIMLIEDCAHSLGAEYKGRKTGTFGDLSIFSLTKNMINFGGGVLATNNEDIYKKAGGILRDEKKGIKARIIDFPLVLAYGLEQLIYKLVFDRIGRKNRWLIKLPVYIIRLRDYLLALMNLPGRIMSGRRRENSSAAANARTENQPKYKININMASLTASLGRSQLRKIDRLIEKRQGIHEKLLQRPYFHFPVRKDANIKDVYTHLVLRFRAANIFEIIEQCNKKGLSLRATWPARQKKWRHLNSDNMTRIEKEILVWSINPDLTDLEIKQFIGIIDEQEVRGEHVHVPSAPRPLDPLNP